MIIEHNAKTLKSCNYQFKRHSKGRDDYSGSEEEEEEGLENGEAANMRSKNVNMSGVKDSESAEFEEYHRSK